MLYFIKGGAKSGKTSFIHEQLKIAANTQKNIFFIVPEQATLQNEKKLFKLLPKDSYKIKVTSFSRFMEYTNSLFGGSDKKAINKVSQLLLMSLAANEVGDSLNIYKRYSKSAPFISELVALSSEFSNAGIAPSDISSFSFSLTDGLLKEKAYEISLLLDAFDFLSGKNFLNDRELAKITTENILNNPKFLKNTDIYIDDFINFTYPQTQLVKTIILAAQNVYISLCTDDTKSDAFSAPQKTIHTFKKFAQENSVPVKENELKTSFMPCALQCMEIAARNLRIFKEPQKSSAIHVNIAKNPYDELSHVAAKIRELVREKHALFGDFVVMTENYERYLPYMEPVFKRYEVPFFMDNPNTATSSPLTNGILTACKVAAGYRNFDLTDLAFSPLTGRDSISAGIFQNYCYIWSATLSQQLLPFKNNPRGFTGELTESDKNNLDIAETTRASLAEPIIHLKKNFKIGTPEAYAKGVYTYLEESRSIANLKKLTDNLSPVESEAFLNSQNLLWEQLVDILDMFCLLPTGISLTPQMFCELLETAASTMETVTIPKAIDCVDVGSCHRMRSYNPPYVFIMGVCQGEFPTISAENSLLSDNDRKKMIEWGLPASDTEAAQELEKAICYRVLTMAEKEMFLSFPALTQKGESITPSIIFSLAERLAEGDEEESPLSLIETKGSLSEQFAQSLGSKENLATVAALANEVLSQKEISRLESSSFKKPHKIESCENSRKLFGENLKLSPSQVENFYSCRYRYFLRYGLKLYPMQKAELSNLEAGTLLHFILEKMIKLHGKNIGSQSEKDLKAEINAFTLEYLQQRIDDFENMGKRLKSNFLKISDWIFELILIMGKELQQTQFTPMFFELPINAKSGIKPLAISCDDGSTATVEGVIDRVDTVSIDSHEYIRIIDYKSGSKVFSLSDVLSGLNMQMLIYIFSIWENGDDFFLKPMPAGILYQPALGKYQLIERNETGNLEKLKLRHYKMNGLLLNDQKVLNAMEPDGLGIFIPFESERSSDEHTATLEQFRRLEGVVKDKIEKMAESLHSGLIDAVPLEINFKRTCENCDYRSICDITDEDKTNRTQNLKKNDFWKVVTEKNED